MTNGAPGRLLPNGPAAAAVLAAGVGCFTMGLVYVLGGVSATLNRAFSIYPAAGALSGDCMVACLVWLGVWGGLHRAWRHRDIALERVGTAALVLLAGGLLLTFPPIARLSEDYNGRVTQSPRRSRFSPLKAATL